MCSITLPYRCTKCGTVKHIAMHAYVIDTCQRQCEVCFPTDSKRKTLHDRVKGDL